MFMLNLSSLFESLFLEKAAAYSTASIFTHEKNSKKKKNKKKSMQRIHVSVSLHDKNAIWREVYLDGRRSLEARRAFGGTVIWLFRPLWNRVRPYLVPGDLSFWSTRDGVWET